jgi:Flp pilus assembly protein TadB
MGGKWKRRLDLFILISYCVCMVFTAVVLATENLWGMAFGQLIAMILLIKYYREARKVRS